MEISKSAVLLANVHQSDQKKCYKCLLYKFSLCFRSRKKKILSMEGQKMKHQGGS